MVPPFSSILLAVLAGFGLSFVVISFTYLFPLDVILQAQILLGGIPFNLQEQNRTLAEASIHFGSYWFWSTFIVLGGLFSWWFLKMFR